MEFIRCDNKDSCDCNRTNGILGSSLEKNISLIEEKLGQSNKIREFRSRIGYHFPGN